MLSVDIIVFGSVYFVALFCDCHLSCFCLLCFGQAMETQNKKIKHSREFRLKFGLIGNKWWKMNAVKREVHQVCSAHRSPDYFLGFYMLRSDFSRFYFMPEIYSKRSRFHQKSLSPVRRPRLRINCRLFRCFKPGARN